ncbi:nicotinamide N-methyltransferase [Lingula anatina]|uniref:Nicotinamide N-methyltransferase n=1 Tax=Lingula anatina TaxID=7574 RepID=A0A1S3KB60_LINAN|nr:nicotinamide N-methyltransferase [Lingula anatina]|eukprot:XP_013419727.1 nicotinamide N-methyltransferase [Lingula anatina]
MEEHGETCLEQTHLVHKEDIPVKKVYSGADYDVLFEPDVYLSDQYSDFVTSSSSEITAIMNRLHEVYSTGNIKGQRLLDIGTGPSLVNLISASRCFEEIYLSDFSTANRDALKKWQKKEERETWSWESFFRHVAKLEGNEDSWNSLQDEFRDKTKAVYFCDVNNANPLSPVDTSPFDTITTSYCLETACQNEGEYRQAMKNVASLLKPRGYFIMLAGLKETYYLVGGNNWRTLPLQEEQYRDALQKADLEVVSWHPIKRQENVLDIESDYVGCFIVVARKKNGP